MLPIVALIGRPNVGKSTLFNLLTHSRSAIVANVPGVTRDRQYGEGHYAGHHFIVIDTGGIGFDDVTTEIKEKMLQQTEIAIREATVILFVVDARSGLTASDEELAILLRKRNKALILAINKIDGVNESLVLSDFSKLGFKDFFPISASNGTGIVQLLIAIQHYLPMHHECVADLLDLKGIRLAVVGRPNVGKSTLINRLLGEERVIVLDEPGTTRDSIFIPMKRGEQDFVLIDTAGVRRRGRITQALEKFSVSKTLQAIKASHVVIIVIDARVGVSAQDLHLIEFIINAGRAFCIAINKWDGLTQDDKKHLKMRIEKELHFADFVDCHFISALHGTNVGYLFKSVQAAYQHAGAEFSTALLTRILLRAVEAHPPAIVGSRHRIKLRYAHLGGHYPPQIIIHGKQTNDISEQYQRYLIHAFMKQLKIRGTPIKLDFKTAENPYKGRKNILSERQTKQRNRLIRHRIKQKK